MQVDVDRIADIDRTKNRHCDKVHPDLFRLIGVFSHPSIMHMGTCQLFLRYDNRRISLHPIQRDEGSTAIYQVFLSEVAEAARAGTSPT